jgi:hypothetical protein
MSGGHFDYKEHYMQDIIDEMMRVKRRTRQVGDDEVCDDGFYYLESPERFKLVIDIAIERIQMAYEFTHRIDWLLSADDSEKTFYRRLVEGMMEIEDSCPDLKDNSKEMK